MDGYMGDEAATSVVFADIVREEPTVLRVTENRFSLVFAEGRIAICRHLNCCRASSADAVLTVKKMPNETSWEVNHVPGTKRKLRQVLVDGMNKVERMKSGARWPPKLSKLRSMFAADFPVLLGQGDILRFVMSRSGGKETVYQFSMSDESSRLEEDPYAFPLMRLPEEIVTRVLTFLPLETVALFLPLVSCDFFRVIPDLLCRRVLAFEGDFWTEDEILAVCSKSRRDAASLRVFFSMSSHVHIGSLAFWKEMLASRKWPVLRKLVLAGYSLQPFEVALARALRANFFPVLKELVILPEHKEKVAWCYLNDLRFTSLETLAMFDTDPSLQHSTCEVTNPMDFFEQFPNLRCLQLKFHKRRCELFVGSFQSLIFQALSGGLLKGLTELHLCVIDLRLFDDLPPFEHRTLERFSVALDPNVDNLFAAQERFDVRPILKRFPGLNKIELLHRETWESWPNVTPACVERVLMLDAEHWFNQPPLVYMPKLRTTVVKLCPSGRSSCGLLPSVGEVRSLEVVCNGDVIRELERLLFVGDELELRSLSIIDEEGVVLDDHASKFFADLFEKAPKLEHVNFKVSPTSVRPPDFAKLQLSEARSLRSFCVVAGKDVAEGDFRRSTLELRTKVPQDWKLNTKRGLSHFESKLGERSLIGKEGRPREFVERNYEHPWKK